MTRNYLCRVKWQVQNKAFKRSTASQFATDLEDIDGIDAI